MSDGNALFLQAQDLIDHESMLLRTRQFRAWLELFASNGRYWVPVAQAQTNPRDGPSHINEARPALDARVERLYDPRVLPQTPASRVSRLLGKPWLIQASGGAIDVAVSFQIAESRPDIEGLGAVRLFAGDATYSLVRDDTAEQGLRILCKRVDLINSESAFFGVSVLL